MTDVKKNVRAVICMLLSLLLMLSMFGFSAAEVSALGLNMTSYNLTKGYSTTLSVTGNDGTAVTWSSSDSSVASVSSTGKVIGKSIGKADITANVGGTKLVCKINVVGGKISASATSVEIEEGSYKYVTVRAKGSHGLRVTPADKTIVKGTWVKPWDGDDIRLKLYGLKSGSSKVTVQLTKYEDVTLTINVKVTGEEDNIELDVNQQFINVNMEEPATLKIYSNKNNSLDYSISDNTIAKVTEGQWKDFYVELTVTGLKPGSATLTISRKDAPNVKKTVPITVSGSLYYSVSDTPPSKSVYTDLIYRWTDSATGSYKYMLLPVGYDLAKVNDAVAKAAGKYEYYTVYESKPTNTVASDKVQTFSATVDNKTVTRYVLVPSKLDEPSYNTAIAIYNKKFEYNTIYNVSPNMIRNNDTIKDWVTVVNGKTTERYMLVPYGYSESWVDSIIAQDGGVYLGGYYGVSMTPPSIKNANDQVLSFDAYSSDTNVYMTYYVLVPADYDEARYNTIVSSYTGYYEYYKVYTSEPVMITKSDTIKKWTKIVDSQTETRYVLLPIGYSETDYNNIKNADLKTQSSNYYIASYTIPTRISDTDEYVQWISGNAVKYMLVPQGYDKIKVNDMVAQDSGVYDYYTAYSTKPTGRATGDQVLPIRHATRGVLYMLIPAEYDQTKINEGIAGI